MSMLHDNIMNAEWTNCIDCKGNFQRGNIIQGLCPYCHGKQKTAHHQFENYKPSKLLMDLYSFCKRIQPDLTLHKWYSSVKHGVMLSVKIDDKTLFEGDEQEVITYLNTCDIHKIHRL